jgi:NADH-quinone oxidoreductase subunit M
MGFVLLGVAAAAKAYGTLSANEAVIAVNGAVLQMFNHGLSAAGMFLLVGVIYERTHTRELSAYRGLFPLAPVYGGILIFTAMASLGLPGLEWIHLEYMVVQGTRPIFSAYTALAMIGLLITGAYILKAIGSVLHGPLNEAWAGHKMEINRREILAIAPLMVLMLSIGVWPLWILRVIQPTVMRLFG